MKAESIFADIMVYLINSLTDEKHHAHKYSGSQKYPWAGYRREIQVYKYHNKVTEK